MLFTTRNLWALSFTLPIPLLVEGNSPIQPPACTNLFIPVTISATNLFIPVTTTATGPVYNVSVHGTYNIGARYCAPGHDVHSRRNVLQFLVHGFGYDRNYWSGHDFQDPLYSWIDYASSQGYPTLSIDSLGNGLSDHPDPTTVVQSSAQVEVIQGLISAARAGQLPGPMIGKKYTKIIYAGHSYGSTLANFHNSKYPSQVDATILTGISAYMNVDFIFSTFLPAFAPAALVTPSKYGTLDLGYVEANNSESIKKAFMYPGGYDPSLFALDYSLRGTGSNGEIASVLTGILTTQYKNPVLIVTGQHDSNSCTEVINGGQAYSCNSTALSDLKKFYPNVPQKDFEWYAPPNSGHCWHFHYDALSTFARIHQWLDAKGF